MTPLASAQYYLYRSPWFMLFTVSNIAFFFVFAATLEGAFTSTQLGYALTIVVAAVGIGAAGMGLEVAAEMDE